MKLLAEHVGLQTWGPVGGPKPNVSSRFCDDIEWMTGRRPGLYWRVTWKIISPLLLLTIFVAYIVFLVWTTLSYKAWNPQYKQFPSRQEKSYPGWVQAICGLLSFLPALLVPGVALAQLPIWRRRKQENVQQNMRLKLQVSEVSDGEVR